jgi:hypothetical protein
MQASDKEVIISNSKHNKLLFHDKAVESLLEGSHNAPRYKFRSSP